MLAVPGIDFQAHNSAFLVAHFHNTIIGGVVFGYFAGLAYWFPKMFGFTLNEKLGKCAFWCWLVGFFVAFVPLYILGAMGMTRRLYHYDAATGFQPFLIVACIGAGIIALGVVFQVLQIIVSIKNKNINRDLNGDPWDGRTLEWTTASPAAPYNFAHIPVVNSIDAFWEQKQQTEHNTAGNRMPYEDIHMPKNTAVGFIIGIFSFIFCFAMVWHIWWLALSGFGAVLITMIMRSCNYDTDYYIRASEVEATEAKYKHSIVGR